MPEPTVHHAVAASALAEFIDGPERPAGVLGARAGAIVLRMGTDAAPACVCLLAHGLTRLPNGVHTDPAALPDPRRVSGARVGAGSVRIGDRAFVVVRRWDSRVRPIEVPAAGLELLQRALDGAGLGVPQTPLVRLGVALAAAAANRGAGDLAVAVRDLVGLGSGLTPGGDDVLAGMGVGLRASGRLDLLDRLAAALGDARIRTTTLSADLLRLALCGQACGEVIRVLDSLRSARYRSGVRGAIDAVDRLLAVGHTSGADLATGLLLGLRAGHATQVSPGGWRRPRPESVTRCPDAAGDMRGGIVVDRGSMRPRERVAR